MSQADVETTTPQPPKLNRFRARSVVAALIWLPFVAIACTSQHISSIFSLMVPPISALMIMLVINWPLRFRAPKLAFTQTDLIVFFAILSAGGSVCGEFTIISQPTSYSYPFHMRSDATYQNQLGKYVPDAFAIKDLALVKDFEGGGKGWQLVVQKLPILLPKWIVLGGIMLSVIFAMLCINSLMRGAWCDRERLTFPLIQLPVAMSEGGGGSGMWKSKHMWIAFGIMFAIDMLNGFNYLYPNLPQIPVKDWFLIDKMLKDPPWSNIGDFRISIYPFMAAIGLFMPSDMLLSFVVFFLLRKATHVLLAANGIPQSTFSGTGISPGPPYFDEQTWGAVLALFLGAIWASKSYLKEVWSDIKTGRKGVEDDGVAHRTAFVGLILSVGVVTVYGMFAGLSPFYMIPYVLLFLIFSIVLTRVRAQLGPPTHEFAFFGSSAIMHRFIGTKWITDAQANYIGQILLFMNRIYRNHPMPYQLEAMKMASIEKVSQKKMVLWVSVTTVLGLFLAYFFMQVSTARTGDMGWNDAPTYVTNIINHRKGPDVIGILMTIVGFALVLGMDMLRFKFPGFPLHPAGYFLSMNYGVDYYWFGMLIALFVKSFVQRYYGLRGYDKLRSVALGILVGEYAAETIWLIVALTTHRSTYTISFNPRSLGNQ